MSINEYIEKINTCMLNESNIKKIEAIYRCEINDILKKVVSYNSEPVFVDGNRFISFNEIVYATEDLHVEFQKEKVIPVVDCMDNDFISYDYENQVWVKFNIIDKVKFDKRNTLEAYFE